MSVTVWDEQAFVTDSMIVEFAKREVEKERERDFCRELDYAVNVTLREYWGEMTPLERYGVTVFPGDRVAA
ncbi:hypothetical protein LCGC14_0450960 [marine sediment metagenome]|uniref:Uncharacterized protein n=1 Tax=marine sediment metagenome TaxID=412755 RepID=A0A0F9SHQ7_9ZZZZ